MGIKHVPQGFFCKASDPSFANLFVSHSIFGRNVAPMTLVPTGDDGVISCESLGSLLKKPCR